MEKVPRLLRNEGLGADTYYVLQNANRVVEFRLFGFELREERVYVPGRAERALFSNAVLFALP